MTTRIASPPFPFARLWALLVLLLGGLLLGRAGAASIAAPASVPVGVTFAAQLSGLEGGGTAYDLDWGDGSASSVIATGSSASATHAFAAPGTYVLRLRPRGGTLVLATATVQATAAAPAAPCTVSVAPNPANPGTAVTATVSNPPLDSVLTLDWGQGGTTPLPLTRSGSVSATLPGGYVQPGTYIVRVLDARGAERCRTVVTVVAPLERPAALTLSVTPATVPVGASVRAVTGNVPEGGGTLDWGDGSTEALPEGASNRTRTYAQPGTYTVRLTAPRATPAVAVVVVTAAAPPAPLGLTVGPPLVTPGQSVTATATNVPASGATLDWGDGTSEALTTPGTSTRAHAYTQPGTYSVRLTAPGALPAVAVVTVREDRRPLSLSVTPGVARPGVTVTAQVTGAVPGATVTLDWDDGSAPGSATAGTNGTLTFTHVYLRESGRQPFLVTASSPSAAGPATAPVVVRVPDATLTAVRVGPRGTPTVFAVAGLVQDPDFQYRIDYGEVTPGIPNGPQPVANGSASRIYTTVGPKTARIVLNAPKYGLSGREVAQTTFTVTDAVTSLTASGLVVSGTASWTAPATATVRQGAAARSRVQIGAQGGGDVRLIWRLAPAASPGSTTPPGNTLDDRVVTLVNGQNTVELSLPTVTPGRYLLSVELRPADPASPYPPVQVLPPQPFVVASGAPGALVVGEGDRRFVFRLENAKLTFPDDGSAAATIVEGTVKLDAKQGVAFPARLRVAMNDLGEVGAAVKALSVRLEPEGAVLTQGSFTVDVSEQYYGPSGKLQPRQRALLVPHLVPMGLKVGLVQFTPDGAVLKGATLVSPDYESVRFLGFIAPGEYQTGQDVEKELGGILKDIYSPNLPFLGRRNAPHLVQVSARQGTAAGSNSFDPFQQALLEGVSTSTGTSVTPAQLAGEMDIEQLKVDLSNAIADLQKAPEVLRFPTLDLYADGDVTSPALKPGSSVQVQIQNLDLMPQGVGFGEPNENGWNGRLVLGDSGVALLTGSANLATLDLSETRAVAPIAGGVQADLLRQTYSGGVGRVRMPDVGPKWRGLLWQSRSLNITKLQGDAEAGNTVGKSDPSLVDLYKDSVPVSFSLNGWNLTVDADLAKPATFTSKDKDNPWRWVTDHVSVVIARSNLVRSQRSVALADGLPLVGGAGVLRGDQTYTSGMTLDQITFEKTAFQSAYGPDATVNVSKVSYLVKGHAFQVDAAFDLAPAIGGLQVTCTGMTLRYWNLADSVDSGPCTFPEDGVEIGGMPIDVDVAWGDRRTYNGVSMPSLILKTSTKLGELPDLWLTTSGNATVTGEIVLGASGQSLPSGYVFTQKTDASDKFQITPGLHFAVNGGTTDLKGRGALALGAGPAALPKFEVARTGTVNLGLDVEAAMNAVFGYDGDTSYWAVAVAVESKEQPLANVAQGLQVYGVAGGLAHHMSWNLGAKEGAYNALKGQPAQRSNAAFTLAAGVVAAAVDDQVLHFNGVITVDTATKGIAVNADGFVLTGGLTASDGYFGGGKPQARLRATLEPADARLTASLCVGEARDKQCDGLTDLSLFKGALKVRGFAEMVTDGKNPAESYVYVGAYRPPNLQCEKGGKVVSPNSDLACAKAHRVSRINATFLGQFEANLYGMAGKIDGSKAMPTALQTSGVTTDFTGGFAYGGELHYEYRDGGSGSVLGCGYSWSAALDLVGGYDVMYTLDPIGATGQAGFGAAAKLTGSTCLTGEASLAVAVSFDGSIALYPTKASSLKGTFHASVKLSSLPSLEFDKDAEISF